MTENALRAEISQYLNFTVTKVPVQFAADETVAADNYTRTRITYFGDEGDTIPAYLLLPQGDGPFPAVLIHHQHNSKRHWGKSEVCGLVGDPWQAFGPVLAARGLAVLAPDSICFEDRRSGCTGLEPHEHDVKQHYDEMCYRLLRGDTLMRKVLDDSARGISLLRGHPQIDAERVGIMGHSYGGNTVLFHAALDDRIAFACSSGAACSYQYKMAHDLGIEMAEVIPGFAASFDIPDLVRCMAPLPVLLVSATADPSAMDADTIEERARPAFQAQDAAAQLEHKRYEGGHPLTAERFKDIVNWAVATARSNSQVV